MELEVSSTDFDKELVSTLYAGKTTIKKDGFGEDLLITNLMND